MAENENNGSLEVRLNHDVIKKTNLSPDQVIKIGRADNDICISKDEVSRSHGKIFFGDGGYFFEDHSSNGSYLNSLFLKDASQKLKHGDCIHIGPVDIFFRSFPFAESEFGECNTVYRVKKSSSSHFSIFDAYLTDDESGKKTKINSAYFTIGTHSDNHFQLSEENGIGNHHCSIRFMGGIPFLESSVYDTLVDCVKVGSTPVMLRDGSTIQIGKKRLNFWINNEEYAFKFGIITQSRKMQNIVDEIKSLACFNLPILIIGETGTGKELAARAIHLASSRKKSPFVAVNCATLSPELADSLLFGHEAGSFTGASRQHQGYFMEANEGTLFLDEIPRLSFETQGKLLRVLQNGVIRPVGSQKDIKVNVRLVSASNIKLNDPEQRKKCMSDDLFFRIQSGIISLPPLRDRKEDIPLLMGYFLRLVQAEYPEKLNMRYFSDECIRQASKYAWPGNIRELQSACNSEIYKTKVDKIETILSSPMEITDGDAHEEISESVIKSLSNRFFCLPKQYQDVIEVMIQFYLMAGRWPSQDDIARKVGMHRNTISKFLKITREQYSFSDDDFIALANLRSAESSVSITATEIRL